MAQGFFDCHHSPIDEAREICVVSSSIATCPQKRTRIRFSQAKLFLPDEVACVRKIGIQDQKRANQCAGDSRAGALRAFSKAYERTLNGRLGVVTASAQSHCCVSEARCGKIARHPRRIEGAGKDDACDVRHREKWIGYRSLRRQYRSGEGLISTRPRSCSTSRVRVVVRSASMSRRARTCGLDPPSAARLLAMIA